MTDRSAGWTSRGSGELKEGGDLRRQILNCIFACLPSGAATSAEGSLIEMGVDSLILSNITVAIEECFQTQFRDEDIEILWTCESFSEMAQEVEQIISGIKRNMRP